MALVVRATEAEQYEDHILRAMPGMDVVGSCRGQGRRGDTLTVITSHCILIYAAFIWMCDVMLNRLHSTPCTTMQWIAKQACRVSELSKHIFTIPPGDLVQIDGDAPDDALWQQVRCAPYHMHGGPGTGSCCAV